MPLIEFIQGYEQALDSRRRKKQMEMLAAQQAFNERMQQDQFAQRKMEFDANQRFRQEQEMARQGEVQQAAAMRGYQFDQSMSLDRDREARLSESTDFSQGMAKAELSRRIQQDAFSRRAASQNAGLAEREFQLQQQKSMQAENWRTLEAMRESEAAQAAREAADPVAVYNNMVNNGTPPERAAEYVRMMGLYNTLKPSMGVEGARMAITGGTDASQRATQAYNVISKIDEQILEEQQLEPALRNNNRIFELQRYRDYFSQQLNESISGSSKTNSPSGLSPKDARSRDVVPTQPSTQPVGRSPAELMMQLRQRFPNATTDELHGMARKMLGQ